MLKGFFNVTIRSTMFKPPFISISFSRRNPILVSKIFLNINQLYDPHISSFE